MATHDSSPAGGSRVVTGKPDHVKNEGRKASRKPAAVKTPPEIPDRPIPKLGWPAFQYKLMLALNKPHRIPKLGRKEARLLSEAYDAAVEMDAEWTEARRKESVRTSSISNLRGLTDQVPSLSFAFWNTKGASATTTTTVLTTAILAEYTRTMTVLVDGNPAAGTCAARLGLDYGDTVTTQQLAQDIQEDEQLAHRDFKSQINRARPSTNGVRVVSADSIIDEHRRLSGKGMSRVLELMGHNSEFLGIDTGNDIGDVVARAIAQSVDVFIFTANVGVPDSLRKLSTSMETLRNLGFSEKVNNSVVVISNLPPGSDLNDYRMYLNAVSFEDKVTRQLDHKFDGQFLGVPRDSYVALDRIVDLDMLSWDTHQAYITVASAILEQSPKLRTMSDHSSGPDVTPPDGFAVR